MGRAVKSCLLALCLACTLSIASIQSTNAARMSEDYQAGYRAYQSGQYKTALSHWQTAALNDDPHAQYALGLLYYRGNVGSPDYREAAKWFGQAARANHGNATYYLGLMYFNGWGLANDQFRATDYFKRALRINPNNSNAAYLIGAQYFHGRGARQNFIEAAHYFEIAAKANMHAAQFMYGAMIERGWGVQQSFEDAYYWLRRAALGPITLPDGAEEEEPMDAAKAVLTLEKRLSADEIKRVDKRFATEGHMIE